MRLRKIVLIVFMAMTLTACGKKQLNHSIVIGPASATTAVDNASEAESRTETSDFSDHLQAKDSANQIEVTCKDKSTCSPSVGALLITNDKTLHKCTVFLLAEDQIMTTSNCLRFGNAKPAQKVLAGAKSNPVVAVDNKLSCGTYSRILFPDVGAGVQATTCDSIVSSDQALRDSVNDSFKDRSLRPSFVTIKLKDKIVGREFFKLQSAIRSQDQDLSIYRVNFSAANQIQSAIQEKISCKVSLKTKGLFQESESSALIRLKNCDVYGGNLGAPIIDGNKNVVGILSSFANKTLSSFNASSATMAVTNPNSYGIATSAACMSDQAQNCNFKQVDSDKARLTRLADGLKVKAHGVGNTSADAVKSIEAKLTAAVATLSSKSFVNGSVAYVVSQESKCSTPTTDGKNIGANTSSINETVNSDWELDFSDLQVSSQPSTACK